MQDDAVTKSDLIEALLSRQQHFAHKDIELVVKTLLETMSKALIEKERIEIRGFGSFAVRYRKPRTGRNPKTGDSVVLSSRYVPHFKPGKGLRERVDAAMAG